MVTFQWKSQTSQNQNFEFFLKGFVKLKGDLHCLKSINKLWRIFRRLFFAKALSKTCWDTRYDILWFLNVKNTHHVFQKKSQNVTKGEKIAKIFILWGSRFFSKRKALPTYIRSKSLFDIRDSWSWPRSPVFPGHSGSLQLKLLLLDSLHNDPGIPVNLGSRFIEHLSILAHLTNIIFQFVQIFILVVHNFSRNNFQVNGLRNDFVVLRVP